jgi:hypothetical protein
LRKTSRLWGDQISSRFCVEHRCRMYTGPTANTEPGGAAGVALHLAGEPDLSKTLTLSETPLFASKPAPTVQGQLSPASRLLQFKASQHIVSKSKRQPAHPAKVGAPANALFRATLPPVRAPMPVATPHRSTPVPPPASPATTACAARLCSDPG